MARKIAWQDLTVLHRYQDKKMVLDNSLRLVHNPGLFSSSLLSLLLPSSEFYAAVESGEGDQGHLLFGQICMPGKDLTARMAVIAPVQDETDQDFTSLISHLAGAAAERGAIQVLGEVPRDSTAEEILSRAGFRAYAEQQVWKLPRQVPYGSGKRAWIPGSRGDNERVLALYQRVLPGQIQHVESPPAFPEDSGMVSWQEGRLVGVALTQFGPRGILLDLVLDPTVDATDEYLGALMFHLPYRATRDVYLRVRSYQQSLCSALERIGAFPGEEQRAMVKKMAVHYNAKQTFAVQNFEKQPDITTPISRTKIKN
ncbi:MAG: hypothetical protein AB8I40_11305 [Anaerolineales bacterium]